MRHIFMLLLLYSFLNTGCNVNNKEEQLDKRETELNQKEHDLMVKEQSLRMKEEEINKLASGNDSSGFHRVTDSIYYDPSLVGLWSVSMNCIETSCSGSAVGDIKTEHWEISYLKNSLIAKVIDKEKVLRVYSGISTSNSIELRLEKRDLTEQDPVNMIVRLQQHENGRLEGRREITRLPDNCKVVYAIELSKQ